MLLLLGDSSSSTGGSSNCICGCSGSSRASKLQHIPSRFLHFPIVAVAVVVVAADVVVARL